LRPYLHVKGNPYHVGTNGDFSERTDWDCQTDLS
jgi:hypothetical protein